MQFIGPLADTQVVRVLHQMLADKVHTRDPTELLSQIASCESMFQKGRLEPGRVNWSLMCRGGKHIDGLALDSLENQSELRSITIRLLKCPFPILESNYSAAESHDVVVCLFIYLILQKQNKGALSSRSWMLYRCCRCLHRTTIYVFNA